MTDAHSCKYMAAYLVQVIDLHIVVAGNQLATLNAPDKDFYEKFYSNLLECIHHRRFKVDFVVEIDKRKQPMLTVLPLDNSMHEEIAKSFPSGEEFVQRILNSNHSDRLKISASQMLFGNMLNLDKGIFIPR